MSGRIAATLAHLVEQGANSAQIAAAIVSTLQEIDAVLGPIIGQGGVAALYKRSLHLTASRHPWLAGTRTGVPAAIDMAALQSVFTQQSCAEAAAAGGVLFQTFYELLTSLIGPALTERLLRSAWTHSFSGSLPQDPSP